MAGKPGKSGGARSGAGRPPKEPPEINVPITTDPKAFLESVMADPNADARMRMDAAKALMPFTHQKLGEGGKKDAANEKAKAAGQGKFGARQPPRLVANNK